MVTAMCWKGVTIIKSLWERWWNSCNILHNSL